MTRILPPSVPALNRAAELLRTGQVVALPTETVYGLAADATRAEAIAKIYEAKQRPLDNPLIVHVGRGAASVPELIARGYVADPGRSSHQLDSAQQLVGRFWPGPLTVVLPRGPALPPEVSAGMSTVGLRMPFSEVFLELLDRLPFPLAAPSANRANRISPTSATDVLDELGGRIPLILDGGPTTVGLESTVVQVDEDGGIHLLRPGGLALEAIERATGKAVGHPADRSARSLSPGRRAVHYAPGKPLILARSDEDPGPVLARSPVTEPTRLALLLMLERDCPPAWSSALRGAELTIRSLGDPGDGSMAARQLFAELRALDAGPYDAILAELPARTGGMWPAIADRLTRAAARSRDRAQ